uniref:U6 snRNA-associated Sm-like protein LSm4 n=1 Tax=Sus scrofa domesticus TaxID=9825 RepID=A0A0B8RSN2_PIG
MGTNSGGCPSVTSVAAPSSTSASLTRSSTWSRRRWWPRAVAAVACSSRSSKRAVVWGVLEEVCLVAGAEVASQALAEVSQKRSRADRRGNSEHPLCSPETEPKSPGICSHSQGRFSTLQFISLFSTKRRGRYLGEDPLPVILRSSPLFLASGSTVGNVILCFWVCDVTAHLIPGRFCLMHLYSTHSSFKGRHFPNRFVLHFVLDPRVVSRREVFILSSLH